MFFARTISFPRMVLYVGGQTVGGALAGFAMSNAYRNRETAVGGCHIDTSLVAPGDALIIELFSCLLLIFVAFAVALDPRRAKGFGTTAPWFVGIILGVVSWATAFTREGYSGAGKICSVLLVHVCEHVKILTKQCRFESGPMFRRVCGIQLSRIPLGPLGGLRENLFLAPFSDVRYSGRATFGSCRPRHLLPCGPTLVRTEFAVS